MSCNLVAVLEEKIYSLEGQMLILRDIRNAAEVTTNKKKKRQQKSRWVIPPCTLAEGGMTKKHPTQKQSEESGTAVRGVNSTTLEGPNHNQT